MTSMRSVFASGRPLIFSVTLISGANWSPLSMPVRSHDRETSFPT